MKRYLPLTACLLLCGAAYAQTGKKTATGETTTQQNLAAAGKSALSGTFTDARSKPIEGVEVFIYEKDSSISASGYTDATGHYETSATLPGVHDIKIVYPGVKRMYIPNVTLKSGLTPLSIKGNIPAADTTGDAATLIPKPAAKATAKKPK